MVLHNIYSLIYWNYKAMMYGIDEKIYYVTSFSLLLQS